MASVIYASQLIFLWRQITGCYDILSYAGGEEECVQNFGSEIFCKIATWKAENAEREWLEGEMANGRKWLWNRVRWRASIVTPDFTVSATVP